MSDDGRDQGAAVGGGVDYKTLFLGACSLVVLLGGAAIGLWNSGAQRNTDRLQQTVDKLTERVTEVEARQREYRYRIEYLERLTERE
jgi:hypothetical protein